MSKKQKKATERRILGTRILFSIEDDECRGEIELIPSFFL